MALKSNKEILHTWENNKNNYNNHEQKLPLLNLYDVGNVWHTPPCILTMPLWSSCIDFPLFSRWRKCSSERLCDLSKSHSWERTEQQHQPRSACSQNRRSSCTTNKIVKRTWMISKMWRCRDGVIHFVDRPQRWPAPEFWGPEPH